MTAPISAVAHTPLKERAAPSIDTLDELKAFVAAVEAVGRFADQPGIEKAMRYAKGRALVAIAKGTIRSWEAPDAARLLVSPDEGFATWEDFDVTMKRREAERLKSDQAEIGPPASEPAI